ncbi:hypothetical protein SCHPADRAFT_924671 [Schizopora paradoxa]|uniref:Fanconi-associated nuclease n=1 Tax=Schizopora paradoxa TaxID=27342 RepID=A0A0H2S5N0_9AGAM|nr:hypothetical protein SCHPADRAFT_924671 [Schizopora paradoxa]
MSYRPSSSSTLADNLVHWSIPVSGDDDDEEEASTFLDVLEGPGGSEKGKAKESMYVSLCEGMVKTVLEKESFLFSAEELEFFVSYKNLSYNARYLLARLLVRKVGKWFRFKELKYVSELGVEGIEGAIEELCSFSKKKSANERAASIFRALSTLDENMPEQKDHENALMIFAEDETNASMPELLECLNVDELKEVARTMKLSSNLTTRKSLTTALLDAATKQSTIKPFAKPVKKGKFSGKDANPQKFTQSVLNFTQIASGASPSPKKPGSASVPTLRKMALGYLKKCIRVNGEINALFHRLHIIYFRSMEHPTTLLTPALLKWCRKRYYANYTYERTSTIFPSREALLAFEEALRMEAIMECMLEGGADEEDVIEAFDKWASSSRPDEMEAPVIPTESDDDYDPNDFTMAPDPPPQEPEVEDNADSEKKETQAAFNARRVLRVFNRVYPRWQQLCRIRKADKSQETRTNGLSRFDEGWILTRIVYKGALAFGCLKNYVRESEILEELLAQRFWRRGKRGAWYDRLALVLMHHVARKSTKRAMSVQSKDVQDGDNNSISCKDDRQKILQRALDVVVAGLNDTDTHIVQRQALEHRLTRLEKQLKLPKAERHECEGKLEKAEEILVMGMRVYKDPTIVVTDKTKKYINNAQVVDCQVPVAVQLLGKDAVRKHNEAQQKKKADAAKKPWKGKSLWIGRGLKDVTVECVALEYYESLGFKGFHSEGSIVSTIFGLLFWDIIFLNVPGAFETPYQSAPLDIASECFYFARRDAIEARLKDIENGKAREILARIDDEHREKATMCVGVRWDIYEKSDLVEIVKLLTPEGLSMICRLFCEDYGGRMSGIPDLLVWRSKDSTIKFVEVKGPGDGLSENQKVWIDVMLRSGITVELCRVAEKGSDDLLNKKRRVKRKMKPIIKKDLRFQDEAEDSPEVIVVDEDDDAELENEQVEECPEDSFCKSEEPPERPAKRRRVSEPTTRCDEFDRGSSPDIPLLLHAKSTTF